MLFRSCDELKLIVYVPKLDYFLHSPFVSRINRIIFLPKSFVEHFEGRGEELKFVIAHEVGHVVLGRGSSEILADEFAASILSPQIGIEALRHSATYGWFRYLGVSMDDRIEALKNMKPFS